MIKRYLILIALIVGIGAYAVARAPGRYPVIYPTAEDYCNGAGVCAGSIYLPDDAGLYCGDGGDYWWIYDATNTQYELNSTDVDGGGTDGVVLYVADGTDDLVCSGEVTVTGDINASADVVLSNGTILDDTADGTLQVTDAAGTGGTGILIGPPAANGLLLKMNASGNLEILNGAGSGYANFIANIGTTGGVMRSNLGYYAGSDDYYSFSDSTAATSGTIDTSIGRDSAGVVCIGSGADCATKGSLTLAGITATGAVDTSAGTLEIPNGTSLPGTCSIGQIFADTDSDDCADTGSGDGCLCVCKASNTWAIITNY